MAKKTLVIVESPAKAKTLQKILGKGYEIQASMGHIRDLPKSKLGVDLENGFTPEYILVRGKGELIKKLKNAAKGSDAILLASDPDREGEAIAWHLAHVLEVDPATPCRIRMYEITARGVSEAVKTPSPIDMNKVEAQQARRILDRVMGYTLSPLLWKKVQPRLSAGRVQSVALRLIADREREIRNFTEQEYWLVDVEASSEDGRAYRLRVERRNKKTVTIADAAEAEAVEAVLRENPLIVTSFRVKETKRAPLPPFKTSTLQQEAARRLGFSPRKTMRIAQTLYEGVELPGKGPVGLITYMRTDSLRLSPDAVARAREVIGKEWGAEYVPEKPNIFAAKGRTQDAHEAIRPTDPELLPGRLKGELSGDEFKLYNMIWQRFTASQMSAAVVARSTLEAECGVYGLAQAGAVLCFEGWGKVWPLDLKEGLIAPAVEGETLFVDDVLREQRFTKPPARYAESGLVKALEEKGIGRPSTYATIIQTLYDRGYVERNDERRLEPTDLGLVVNDFLVAHFPGIVDVGFTAGMESELDEVEQGGRPWVDVVDDFWRPFSETLASAEKNAERVRVPVKEIGEACPECGAPLVIKRGRFGEFIACSGYPNCSYTRPILKTLGIPCPTCGKGEVVRRRTKKGRFFYGCSLYPACDFVSWNQPSGEKCPECGAPLMVRGKNKPSFCPACSGQSESTEPVPKKKAGRPKKKPNAAKSRASRKGTAPSPNSSKETTSDV